jgi:hypothetical protein
LRKTKVSVLWGYSAHCRLKAQKHTNGHNAWVYLYFGPYSRVAYDPTPLQPSIVVIAYYKFCVFNIKVNKFHFSLTRNSTICKTVVSTV